MKHFGILLSCLLVGQAWAASTVDMSGELKAESKGENITLEDSFASHLKQSLSQRMKLESKLFDIKVSNLLVMPPVKEGSKVELVELFAIGSNGATRMDGLISIPANILVDKKTIQEVTLSGLVKVNGPVWVAASSIPRAKVVQQDSLRLTKMPWSRLPSNAFLTKKEDLVGRALKRTVSRGAIIYPDILKGRDAVKNGDAVVLTIQSGPGVTIRSRALAKQAGSIGDVIRVEQPETRKELRAIITGRNKVEVQL